MKAEIARTLEGHWILSSCGARSVVRALAHSSLGALFVIGLLAVPRNPLVAISGAATGVFLLAELCRFLFPSFRAWLAERLDIFLRAEESNRITGATYFLIGGTLTVLLFPPEIALLAIVFLAFGDPVAGIAGRWKGKRRRPSGKSLEGDLACLTICLGACLISTFFLGDLSVFGAVAGALAATAFQATDLPVNDNITIPLGAAAIMFLLSVLMI